MLNLNEVERNLLGRGCNNLHKISMMQQNLGRIINLENRIVEKMEEHLCKKL